jgi:hypothetical protein
MSYRRNRPRYPIWITVELWLSIGDAGYRQLFNCVICSVFLAIACSNSQAQQEQESMWKQVESGTTLDLYDIWGTSKTDVWAVGDKGVIVHYDGHEWTSYESGTDLCLRSVYGFGKDDVWIVGGESRNSSNDDVLAEDERGIILHFDGQSWSEVTNDEIGPLKAIWGLSSNEIYVGGRDLGKEGQGLLMHYNGDVWERLDLQDSKFYSCRDLWGSDDGRIWMATGKEVLHFDNSGWTVLLPESFGQTTTVWGTSKDDVWVGHCLGEISHGDSETMTNFLALDWEEDTGAFNFYGLWGTGTSDIFAVGGFGENVRASVVYHFDGTKWTEQNVREMSELLYGVWGVSSTEVWAVGEGGVILEYRDEQ